MKVPAFVGVPLILIVFDAKVAVTPDGKPVAPPIPVAPDVVCIISVNGVFIHNIGDEEAGPTVLADVTVMVPVAFPPPQPPVNGIL